MTSRKGQKSGPCSLIRTSSGKEQDEVRMKDPGNPTGRLEQSTSQWGSPNSAPTGRLATLLSGGWVLGRDVAGFSRPGWVSTESAPTFPNSRQERHPDEIGKEKEKS